jgi:hypothetical protein
VQILSAKLLYRKPRRREIFLPLSDSEIKRPKKCLASEGNKGEKEREEKGGKVIRKGNIRGYK